MTIKTPIKSIRAKCIECTGGSLKEIRECLQTGCPLHPYRMGKNPNRKGIGGRKGALLQENINLSCSIENEN